MNPTQTFIVFALEAYKNKFNLTSEELLSDFKTYEVFDFLSDSYDVLHTQSMDYIVEEISEYIKSRK